MNSIRVLFLSLFGLAFFQVAQAASIDDDKARLYIKKYQHIAVSEMERTGIPASIKMAQAILESGAGEGKLAQKANNHFGIKCGGPVWKGTTYYMWDDESSKSCFRVYANPDSSFIAHSGFLTNPKKDYRYGFLFKLDPYDYKAWAKGLQKAGYATSKTYSKNLIALIERLDLYKLDYLSTQVVALSKDDLVKFFPSIDVDSDTQKLVTVVNDPFATNEDSLTVRLTKEVFQINGLATVFVQPNDNLAAISKRYKLSLRKLKRYNELKGRTLQVGQYIFLARKNKRLKDSEKHGNTHIVRKGQSMYAIAQLYGIRYKRLVKMNKIYRDKTPRAGSLVFLRNK